MFRGEIIDDAILLGIMPQLGITQAIEYAPWADAAAREFSINTSLRLAAWLGQLAHESGQLKYWRELADGRAYEHRRDLGNLEPGDGTRFVGRGPIQITGRSNYTALANATGIDCVNKPDLLEKAEHGFRAAGWFWKTHLLNDFADRWALASITKIINGGLNHYDRRVQYSNRALEVLQSRYGTKPV